jgi:hypothetical protein
VAASCPIATGGSRPEADTASGCCNALASVLQASDRRTPSDFGVLKTGHFLERRRRSRHNQNCIRSLAKVIGPEKYLFAPST